MKANYDQATANVTGLTAQVAFNAKRNEDIQKLAAEGANTEFQAQDRQNQYETMLAQLNAAKSAQAECQTRAGFRDWRRSTRQSRRLRAQLDNARLGIVAEPTFARPPTAMLPWSH